MAFNKSYRVRQIIQVFEHIFSNWYHEFWKLSLDILQYACNLYHRNYIHQYRKTGKLVSNIHFVIIRNYYVLRFLQWQQFAVFNLSCNFGSVLQRSPVSSMYFFWQLEITDKMRSHWLKMSDSFWVN